MNLPEGWAGLQFEYGGQQFFIVGRLKHMEAKNDLMPGPPIAGHWLTWLPGPGATYSLYLTNPATFTDQASAEEYARTCP